MKRCPSSFKVPFIINPITRLGYLNYAHNHQRIAKEYIQNGIKAGLFALQNIKLVHIQSDVPPTLLHLKSLANYEKIELRTEGRLAIMRKGGKNSLASDGKIVYTNRKRITPIFYCFSQSSNGCCSENLFTSNHSRYVRTVTDLLDCVDLYENSNQFCYVGQFRIENGEVICDDWNNVEYDELVNVLMMMMMAMSNTIDFQQPKNQSNTTTTSRQPQSLIKDIPYENSSNNYRLIDGRELQKQKQQQQQQKQQLQKQQKQQKQQPVAENSLRLVTKIAKMRKSEASKLSENDKKRSNRKRLNSSVLYGNKNSTSRVEDATAQEMSIVDSMITPLEHYPQMESFRLSSPEYQKAIISQVSPQKRVFTRKNETPYLTSSDEESDSEDYGKSLAKRSKRSVSDDNKENELPCVPNTGSDVAYQIQKCTATVQQLKELNLRGQLVRRVDVDYMKSLMGVKLTKLFSSSNPTPTLISTTSNLFEKAIVIEGNHRFMVLSTYKKLTIEESEFRVKCGLVKVDEEEFESIWELCLPLNQKLRDGQQLWQPITKKLSFPLKMVILGVVSGEARRCSSVMSPYDESVFYNDILSTFIDDREKEALRIGTGHFRMKKLKQLVEQGILYSIHGRQMLPKNILWIFLLRENTQKTFMRGLKTKIWPTQDFFYRTIFEASVTNDDQTKKCLEDFVVKKPNAFAFRNQLRAIQRKKDVVDTNNSMMVAKSIRNTTSIKSMKEAESGGFVFYKDCVPDFNKNYVMKNKLTLVCIRPSYATLKQLRRIPHYGFGSINNKLFGYNEKGRSMVYIIAGEFIEVMYTRKMFENLASLVISHLGSNSRGKKRSNYKIYEYDDS